jgi:hypothetical protein
VHQVVAIFDEGALTPAVKPAFTRSTGLLPGGAARDPSAAADEKHLPDLFKAQHAEQRAKSRSTKLLVRRCRLTVSELMLKAPGTQCSKLTYDGLLSSFAFSFKAPGTKRTKRI